MVSLKELQSDILNSSTKLSSILLKTKLFARDLQNIALNELVEKELNGYIHIEDSKLPEYRQANCYSLGQLIIPGGFANTYPVNLSKQLAEPYKWANTAFIRDSVSEIEVLLETERDSFEQLWPHELSYLLYERPSRVWKVISRTQFAFILNSVRNKLLTLLMEVKTNDLATPENLFPNEVSLEKNSQVFTTYVNGGNNIIASGHSIQQTVEQNISGIPTDEISKVFASLIEKLDTLPNSADKNDAQNALIALEKEARKGDNVQEKVIRKWFNFLYETAPDAWEVAMDTLTNPIKGLSTIFKKVAEKTKAEQKAKNAG